MSTYIRVLALAIVVLGIWSVIQPFDMVTWWMETIPGWVGLVILILTARRFPLTPLAYTFIALHITILFVGGHYSYARVPLGDWMKDWFHVSRNHFDRIGHFAQGFVPALITRELFIRKSIVRSKGWRFTIVICICLAISAAYELIEWGAAMALGQGADEFLATQGDPWDTQEDMATALIGACTAMLVLPSLHDKQLQRFNQNTDV